MFKDLNSKQQGNIGLSSAILYFTLNKNTVSIPLNDSQEYDLVVEINNTLYKVQVKTTGHKINNHYSVCLKSSGGTSGKIYHTLQDSDCHLLFVLCEDGSQYLIPRDRFLKNKTKLNLGKEMDEYRLQTLK